MLPNRAGVPADLDRLARLGAAMVPLNPQYRAQDAGHILAHSHGSSRDHQR